MSQRWCVGDAWQRMANAAKRPLATQVHVAQTLKEEHLRSLKINTICANEMECDLFSTSATTSAHLWFGRMQEMSLCVGEDCFFFHSCKHHLLSANTKVDKYALWVILLFGALVHFFKYTIPTYTSEVTMHRLIRQIFLCLCHTGAQFQN